MVMFKYKSGLYEDPTHPPPHPRFIPMKCLHKLYNLCKYFTPFKSMIIFGGATCIIVVHVCCAGLFKYSVITIKYEDIAKTCHFLTYVHFYVLGGSKIYCHMNMGRKKI